MLSMKRTLPVERVMITEEVRVPFAEEAHAAQQRAFGDTGSGENHLLAGRQLLGNVDLVFILDAHACDALFQGGRIDHEPAFHIAVKAANRRRRHNAFRRAS